MISELLQPVVVSGIVSFLVALGTAEYRLRRKQTVEAQQQVQSWYAEAAQLASYVRILWKNEYQEKRTLEGGMVQYDEIQQQMKLRSRQINNHISDSKSVGVDQDISDELEVLSRLYSSFSDMTVGIGSKEGFQEAGEEIIEQAEKVEERALTKLSE